MPRFTPTQLLDQALAAIEEAAAAAMENPIERTAALRFALMYLANDAAERWPHDTFWREIAAPPTDRTQAVMFGRHQTINAAVNGIRAQLGLGPR